MLTAHRLLPLLADATALHLRLPHAEIPVCFHVTEIGTATKDFLDCGGTRRRETWQQWQIWVGPDVDHRLAAGKLAGILKKSEAAGFDGALPIRLECEDPAAAAPVAGFYHLVDATRTPEGAVVLAASPVRTTCLAMDQCMPSHLLPGASAGPCCGPTGCC